MQEANQLSENEMMESPSEETFEHSTGMEAADEPAHEESSENGELPLYAKERIGKLQKRHNQQQKELRRLKEELYSIQQRLAPQNNDQMSYQQPINSYEGDDYNQPSQDELIRKAVASAFQHKDMLERQAKEQEQIAHIQKQYKNLEEQLDQASNKYEDFDDVIHSDEAIFTPHMVNASLLIPNAPDVLYKLGKNREEARRISQLHPLEQSREVVKLSMALLGNETSKQNQPYKAMGTIKSTPVSSKNGVSENTSISELRRLMKNGWK